MIKWLVVFVLFVTGLVTFLGGASVPVTKHNSGGTLTMFLGAALMLLAVVVLVRFTLPKR